MERLKVSAGFHPESAAQTGLEGYDDKIVDLTRGFQERYRNALRKVIDRYRTALESETESNVRQDLQILIETAEQQLALQVLNEMGTLTLLLYPRWPLRSLSIGTGFAVLTARG